MFLKHCFNNSNTCCDQALKKKKKKTKRKKNTQLSYIPYTSARALKIKDMKSLKVWLTPQTALSVSMITNQIDFISVRSLQKILLRMNWGLDDVWLKMFYLRSPSWRSVFALVGLLTLTFLQAAALSAITCVYG